MRAIAFIESEEVRLQSRSGLRCERQYPELAVIHHQVAAAAGHTGWRDRGARSERRLAVSPDSAAHRQQRSQHDRAPGALHAGGLLRVRPALPGWVRSSRRAAGEAPRTAGGSGDAGRTLCAFPKLSPAPARRCWKRRAKPAWKAFWPRTPSSTYESRRSREWLKIKLVSEQEFVIGGFTEPQGGREPFRRSDSGRAEGRQAAVGGKCRHRFRRANAGRSVRPAASRWSPENARSPFGPSPTGA